MMTTLTAAIALWIYMTLFYFLARKIRNFGLADFAWGGGFALVAWTGLLLDPGPSFRDWTVAVMTSLWALRLILHIWPRLSKPEDFRYAQMRKNWGKRAGLYGYTHVFMLQGILLYLIAFPILMIIRGDRDFFGTWDLIGIIVWGTGLSFETMADLQLKRFLRSRSGPGRILQAGLWRYSRHPNYFGEALLWWGFFFMALPGKNGWLAAISPLLIDFLLLKVSGVPLLEKHYRDNAEYQEYAARTSLFIPWFPKKIQAG
jgi:steroid 5-alpha reductase family enzyme